MRPASVIRALIFSTGSSGSGTAPTSVGKVAFGRPARNSRRGAPGQLETPTAPANWIRSPAVTLNLPLLRKGVMLSIESSIPLFAPKSFFFLKISVRLLSLYRNGDEYIYHLRARYP